MDSVKKQNRKKNMYDTVALMYGMLMVLMIELESKRVRRDSGKFHWDDIESDMLKYYKIKKKEFE